MCVGGGIGFFYHIPIFITIFPKYGNSQMLPYKNMVIEIWSSFSENQLYGNLQYGNVFEIDLNMVIEHIFEILTRIPGQLLRTLPRDSVPRSAFFIPFSVLL